MPTTTKITHNRNEPGPIPQCDLRAGQMAVILSGPIMGSIIVRTDDNHRTCLLSLPDVSIAQSEENVQVIVDGQVVTTEYESGKPVGLLISPGPDVEPEPIPMNKMKPGGKCRIATVSSSNVIGKVGDWAVMDSSDASQHATRLSDGSGLFHDNYTVIPLQPGESLTIEVEREEPATPGGCKYYRKISNGNQYCDHTDQTWCKLADGEPCEVYSPRPIEPPTTEPETLDHALRHGTAEEIVAAALLAANGGDKAECFAACLCELQDGRWHRHLPSAGHFESLVLLGTVPQAMLGMIDHLHDRDLSYTAKTFVELRDRLGLFKGEG